MAAPFDTPHFKTSRFHQLAWYQKRILTNFVLFFPHLIRNQGPQALTLTGISKEDFSLQYVTIDDVIEGIKRFGPGSFLAKTDRHRIC